MVCISLVSDVLLKVDLCAFVCRVEACCMMKTEFSVAQYCLRRREDAYLGTRASVFFLADTPVFTTGYWTNLSFRPRFSAFWSSQTEHVAAAGTC